MRVTAKNLALMAIFAALYAVLALIVPIQIPTGVGNLEISFAAWMAAVMGVILGPYLGMSAAFLGAFVAWVLPPSNGNIGGLPFLLSPPLNALITGLIFYKKWKYALAAFSVLVIAFLFTPPIWPVTENAIVAAAVLFDKIIAIVLIIPVALFAKKLAVAKASLLFFILFFVGNEADNMWGSLIFATPMVYDGIFGIKAIADVQFLFLLSPFAYPIVRIIQATVGMLVAVPLMYVLKDTPWLWRKENILTQNEHKTTVQEPYSSDSSTVS